MSDDGTDFKISILLTKAYPTLTEESYFNISIFLANAYSTFTEKRRKDARTNPSYHFYVLLPT